MPRRVRLVTCAAFPEGDGETRFLADTLRERGWTVDVAVWSDPGVAWDDMPATVLRSTWDYPEHLPRFLAWADTVSRVTDLHNPPRLVHRNVDKRYLVELGAAGVPVVPTRWIPEATPEALTAVGRTEGWTDGVLKPAVGLDGVGVERVTLGDSAAERAPSAPELGAGSLHVLAPARPRCDAGWLVQPFLRSVLEDGERGVVFVDGRPSHAVRKQPPVRGNEFRVQERWGGATLTAEVDPEADALCRHALTTWLAGDPDPLYARVDLLRWHGMWRVAEIEVIEPSLYFLGDTRRVDTFEAALVRRCGP